MLSQSSLGVASGKRPSYWISHIQRGEFHWRHRSRHRAAVGNLRGIFVLRPSWPRLRRQLRALVNELLLSDPSLGFKRGDVLLFRD